MYADEFKRTKGIKIPLAIEGYFSFYDESLFSLLSVKPYKLIHRLFGN